MSTKTPLEFWFEFGSNYSYLSVMRIEELARAANVEIAWKPFLLGPIFRDFGWNTSPFVVQAEKGRWVWKDMERQAQKYGLPFRMPSTFPRSALLPMRVAISASNQPWIGAFCKAVMRQNFVEDADISDVANVKRALMGLVAEPDALVAAAQTDENKSRLREQTAEAKHRGVFGAPTFFVGAEMFWGNDRLEDAVACARGAGPSFDQVPKPGFTLHRPMSAVTRPWEPIYSRVDGGAAAVLALWIREPHCNSRGILHGGVAAALADNAMSLACANAYQGDCSPVTVGLQVDYVRQVAKGSWLEIRPSVIKLGRALGFAQAHALADEQIVARASATFYMHA